MNFHLVYIVFYPLDYIFKFEIARQSFIRISTLLALEFTELLYASQMHT